MVVFLFFFFNVLSANIFQLYPSSVGMKKSNFRNKMIWDYNISVLEHALITYSYNVHVLLQFDRRIRINMWLLEQRVTTPYSTNLTNHSLYQLQQLMALVTGLMFKKKKQ